MNQQQAEAIADALGGEAWQSGGGTWIVSIHREDGHLVVVSGDAVCEYSDEDAFDRGAAAASILLRSGLGDSLQWVVQCEDGQTIYRNPDMKVGWRWREEAEEVASGLQSRTGEIHFVREHNPS